MGLNLLQRAKMLEDWRDMYIAQKLYRIKSNQIYFSVAGNNNTQYKSIDLKYEIPLLKENGWSDKLTLTPSQT